MSCSTSRFRKMAVIFSLVAAVAIGWAGPAGAALTWDANGTGDGQTDGAGVWLGTGQWWDGAANQDWVSGSDANFGNGGAGGAVTLAGPTTVNSLTLNSFTGTYTLGTAAQAITLNTGLAMNSGAGAVTIVSPITLGGSQNWTNNSASTFTVSGAPDAVANTLTLDGSGAGLTTLTGGLSFSGAGGLVIGKSGALGTTISGGAITLGGTGGIVINSGASAVSLGAATISAAQSWANNSSNAMTTAGILAINSQLSLTAGTVKFGNFANTGTGGVVISGATAQAGNAAAFGTGTLTLTSGKVSSDSATARILTNAVSINGPVTLGDATNNGALTFSGATQAITGSNTITLGGGNVSFTTAAMSLAAGSNTTFSSAGPTLTMSGGFNTNGGTDTLTLNTAANAVTLSGALSGTGTLVMAGSGTNVTLGALTGSANVVQINSTTGGVYTSSGASTFTGGVTLTSGTLNINLAGTAGASGPLGNGGAFTINGGTIDNTSGAAKVLLNVNPITLGGDFAFSTSAGTALNNLTLPGAITMAADRTVTLNGLGALALSGLLTNTADSVRTLTVNNGTGTGATSLLTIGSYNLTGPGSTGARTDIINGTGNVTITGVVGNGVSAGSGLTYSGSGILTLSGANTYTGATTVNGGVLRLNNANALPGGIGATNGTSALTINGGVVELANGNFLRNLGTGAAQFQITGGVSGFSAQGAARVVTVNNDAALELVWGSATFAPDTLVLNAATANNTLTLSNNVNLGATSRIIAVNANTATLSGVISGSGGLTKIGAGTLTISKADNDFTGNTVITNGKVALGAQFALWKSAYDTTGSTGAIGLDRGTQVAPWLGGLAGSVNLATAITGYGSITSLNLNPQTGSSVSYGGVIANGAANMTLNKTGHGTQTLTGTNSYSGATTVWAGTLALAGASGTALSSAFTVRGGTLLLDNSTAWANRIADTLAPSALSLGSLTLTSSNGAGIQSETVGATTFAVGGKVTINNGTTGGDQTTLALGAVTRSAGAAINFVGTGGTLGGGVNSPNVTTTGTFPGGSNNILPWATVGGTTWAGTASTNSIVAYAGAFVDPTSAASNAADNAQLTGSGTMNAGKSFNSLNVISSGASQSFDLSTAGVLTLTSGAILKSGTNAYTISGSAASAITAGTELRAHVDGGALTISAPLNTAIVGLAKGGTGDLILSGTRAGTWTGPISIAGGRLEFQGAGLTLNSLVTGAGGLTVNLNPGQTLILGDTTNSYAGQTIVKGGYLTVDAYNDDGLPGGIRRVPFVGTDNTSLIGTNLKLEGGVFYSKYVFNKDLGEGPNQIQILSGTSGIVSFANSGGAYGLTLDSGRELVWGSTYFSPTVFVHSTVGDQTLNLANGIDLTGSTRTILVGDATYNALAGGGASQLGGAIRTSIGTAGLTKTGVGILLLSGASTFNGAVTVSQGTLAFSGNANVASANPLGQSSAAASNLLLGNGTTLKYTGAAASTDRSFTITGTADGDSASLNASGTGAISFTNTASPAYGTIGQTRTLILTGTNTGNNTLAAGIADNGLGAVSVTKTGAGTWVLSGANSYSGATSVNAGRLQFATPASLYNGAAANWVPAKINVVGGATLSLNVGGGSDFLAADLDTLLDNSHLGNSTATTGLNWGAILALDTSNASFSYSTAIANPNSGANALTLNKLGANTLSLSGASSYTGGTTISAGTVSFTGTGLAGSGWITFGGNSTLQWGAGTTTDLSSRLVINNGITATIDANGNDIDFATGFGASGTGALTKDGAGTLTLSAANTYTGLTKATTGTLTLANNLAIQYSAIDTTGAGNVAFSSGVTTPTIGGLAGAVNLATKFTSGYSAAVTELTLNPLSGTQTYTGVISDGATGMTLTKTGAGTQVLQGVNTYTGATNVNAGILTVSGNGVINMSTAINLNGGNLTLTNTTTAQGSINRVHDSNPITSNGGTITYTNTSANNVAYAETIGSVALTSGQLNVVEATNQAGTGTSSQTLTIGTGGITRTGAANTSAVTFSSAGTRTTKNMIVVSGATATDTDKIIGPWATIGTTAALQTDYAIYNASAQVVDRNTAATANNTTWSTAWADSSNYNFANGTTGTTLTATRNINTLRHTGGAETLTVATDANLGTLGILNGVTGLLTIAATGTGAVTLPTTDADKVYVNAGSGAITINAPIKDNTETGALTLVKTGSGTLTVSSAASNYSGGTVVNAGTLTLASQASSAGLGTGPITVMPGATLSISRSTVTNDIYITDAKLNAQSGYAAEVFTGTITLGGSVILETGTSSGTKVRGNITGSGSLTVNDGRYDQTNITALSGTNTYTGPTRIGGYLKFTNRVSLYNADTAKWTADNLIVPAGSCAVFDVGGGTQFTSSDIETLAAIGSSTGGFMNGSFIGLDTVTASYSCSSVIGNPNGGANVLGLNKFGDNTLTLTGNSTYTAQTRIYQGAVSVSSINSVVGGSASSNLGAPKTVADGTIMMGLYGKVGTLIYTGAGETTDRVIALTNYGGGSYGGATIDQSGTTGLLKFTSDMVTTGVTGRPITFQGSTAGTGEFAGVIPGPQTVAKSGSGTWKLSAANTYTGVTTVNDGVLLLTNINALPGGIGATGGSGALTFDTASNGVIGLGVDNFYRPLTDSGVAGGVYFNNRGGWAAFGADRVVNIGGDLRTIVWGTQNGGFNSKILVLGAKNATDTVDLQNPIDLTGATRTVHVLNGAAAIDAEMSGVISGTAGLNRSGTGTLYLSNIANTYTGATTLDTDATVCVSKLDNGGANSSIGASPVAAANLSLNSRSTLRYLGSGDSTDRSFTINGTAADDYATLDASGTGAVSFTNAASPAYGTVDQTRTLILAGANTGNNTLAAGIANNGTGAVSVTKSGGGKWVLSGSNTYTGNTTVDAGTLDLASTSSMKFVIGATSDVNNRITGAGAVSLAGIFDFDLSSAGTTLNDSWQIVNVDTLTEAFRDTFSVTSTFGPFTPDVGGDKWTRLILSTSSAWEFTESTGTLKVVVGIRPGDTNADGVVDAADFITLKKNFGTSTGAGVAAGDFNATGTVNWADLNILTNNMGTGGGGAPATTPEPATLGLLAIGALAIIRRRRRA